MEEIKKRIIDYFDDKNPVLIYIFGSYAKGGFTEESDIDIAVLLEEDIDDLELYRYRQNLVDLLELGIPVGSVEAFEKLLERGVISQETFKTIKGMVGFRNVAVHQYQQINYRIVEVVIKEHLGDFRRYSRELIENVL